jgi:predicted thioesterase
MSLEVGLTGELEWTVAESDLATAQGSGDVRVLGTPRAVALCEAATLRALAGRLAAGETSVGTRVELDHLAASAPGARVVAQARLAEVSGRKLVFEVALRDGDRVAARGRVWRAVVQRARFLASMGEN